MYSPVPLVLFQNGDAPFAPLTISWGKTERKNTKQNPSSDPGLIMWLRRVSSGEASARMMRKQSQACSSSPTTRVPRVSSSAHHPSLLPCTTTSPSNTVPWRASPPILPLYHISSDSWEMKAPGMDHTRAALGCFTHPSPRSTLHVGPSGLSAYSYVHSSVSSGSSVVPAGQIHNKSTFCTAGVQRYMTNRCMTSILPTLPIKVPCPS